MKNYFRLNLPFQPLIDSFEFPVSSGNAIRIHHPDFNFLSKSCREWIENTNLTLQKILVFECPAGNNQLNIHIDGHPPNGRTFGINWNYNTENFEMMWFKEIGKGTYHNYDGTIGITYTRDNVELIEKGTTPDPVLFRTDIPHCVVNYSNKIRYSVSLVFYNRPKWEEIVNHLNDYILE